MLRRVGLAPALAGGLLLLAAGVAQAHTAGPAEPVTHALPTAPASIGAVAPTPVVPVWAWLAALAALPVLGGRRRRRAVAAALVPVLVFFAAQSALHSVHHAVSDTRDAVCPVASAAAHVAGTDPAPVALATPAPALERPLPERAPRAVALRPLGPHQGRAPPAVPSV